MKKLLATFAVVMAVSALHAASIDWSVNLNTQVMKDYLGTANYSSTVYFIYAADLTGLYNPEQTKEQFLANLGSITLNDEYSANSDGKIPGISKITVTDSRLKRPTIEDPTKPPVAIFIFAEDAVGNGFGKNLTVPCTPYNPEDGTSEVKTSWLGLKNADWSQVYSVPEPATGALALAGLALIFRRKRA